jgi:trimeric autotransporter adhesin
MRALISKALAVLLVTAGPGAAGIGALHRLAAPAGAVGRPASSVITTVAGSRSEGFSGDGGPATRAQIYGGGALAIDAAGDLYIVDPIHSRVRRVAAHSGVITTVAGNGTQGFSGDGGPATAAELNSPFGVAVDATGNLYIADSDNARVRRVAAGTGVITTVAGSGVQRYDVDVNGGPAGDGGPATAAEIDQPRGVTVDATGNLYIADLGSQRLRKVDARNGLLITVAGDGSVDSHGDGGPALAAGLAPYGVAVDTAGNLYVTDLFARIREVSAATGLISTVAGDGNAGFSGDGGRATDAEIGANADSVAVDAAGNLYIADTDNQRVRRVAAGTGVITTVVGNGREGFSGDGGPPAGAELSRPQAVATDAAGNLYILERTNVREVRTAQPALPPSGATPGGPDGPPAVVVAIVLATAAIVGAILVHRYAQRSRGEG